MKALASVRQLLEHLWHNKLFSWHQKHSGLLHRGVSVGAASNKLMVNLF